MVRYEHVLHRGLCILEPRERFAGLYLHGIRGLEEAEEDGSNGSMPACISLVARLDQVSLPRSRLGVRGDASPYHQ